MTDTTSPGVTSGPRRVRLSRRHGWRLPSGATSVARPTKWGNPYVVTGPDLVVDTRTGDRWTTPDPRAVAVELHAQALGLGVLDVTAAEVRRELAGRDLACWCPEGQPCHAATLLRVANRSEP